MPVSDINNLTPIMGFIQSTAPRRIADLGIGMGKYGALAREVLDYTYGRFDPQDWQHQIVGYEGFASYMNPMWDLYDRVTVADFSLDETLQFIIGNDLVMMVDSLEHIEFDRGLQVLRTLAARNKKVLVSCPNGDYPQGAAFGNEFERHRSVWDIKTMLRHGGIVIHRGLCTVAVFERMGMGV